MKKVCVVSKHLTSLESNTVYMGKTTDVLYNCPDGMCAELGSQARPSKTLTETLSVIEKRFAPDTPVSIAISAGSYDSGNITSSIELPKNVVALKCMVGTASLKSDIIVDNVPLLQMENISLEGDLHIKAYGNHVGDFSWKGGQFLGTYSLDLKENAKQSMLLEDIKQDVYATDLGQVYDNMISIQDMGEGTLTRLRNTKNSPFKGKTTVSGEGKLIRKVQNCIINSGGDEQMFSDKSDLYEIYSENTITKNISASDSDYFTDRLDDACNIQRVWNFNRLTIHLNEGKSLYKNLKLKTSNSTYKGDGNTFVLSGNGSFMEDMMEDAATSFFESSDATINASGEGYFKKVLLKGNSSLYQLLTKNNINTPLLADKTELEDNARHVLSEFNGRSVTAGYETILSGKSSMTLNLNQNYITSGSRGFHGKAIVSNNARFMNNSKNLVQRMFNKIDHNVHDLIVRDYGSIIQNSSGNENTYVLNVSEPGVDVSVCNVVQGNDSTINRKENNGQVNIKGGKILNLVQRNNSAINCNGSSCLVDAEIPESSVLYDVENHDNSTSRFLENLNTKNVVGGRIHKCIQKDTSTCQKTLRGENIVHTSEHPTFIVEVDDDANHDFILNGSSIESSTIQQDVKTLANSVYRGEYNSNRLKAPLLVKRFSDLSSTHDIRSNSQSLEGDSEYEGPIVSKIANTIHLGNRKVTAGDHTWSNSELNGLLQTINSKFLSNFSVFKNTDTNIESTNTNQNHNLTSFETTNANNIVSNSSVGELLNIILRTCNLKNKNIDKGHIKVTHDSNKNSKHDIKTGILHTSSKTLIESDLVDRVRCNFSSAFKNETKEPVRARVGTLTQSSTGVIKST